MTTRTHDPSAVVVMVVEDHELMRETLVDEVARLAGFEVGASVGSGEEALDALDDHRGLVLVDLSLPGIGGDDLVREIVRRQPATRCVMLSGHRERRYVERSLAAGACAYVVKGYPEEIEMALRAVASGGRFLSRSLEG